jgi:hypothetical protein
MRLSDKDEAVCEAVFAMDGKEAASFLIALLAIKVLQDNPAWGVAKARTENSVKGLLSTITALAKRRIDAMAGLGRGTRHPPICSEWRTPSKARRSAP